MSRQATPPTPHAAAVPPVMQTPPSRQHPVRQEAGPHETLTHAAHPPMIAAEAPSGCLCMADNSISASLSAQIATNLPSLAT